MNTRKGIILAGGKSTRLYPITLSISKQLIPIYDKPMIYYPLSTLMEAEIREILIITNRDEQNLFKKILGDGSQFGIRLEYAIQDKPNGLAEAFVIGKDFIGTDDVVMILGDNIFYGSDFKEKLLSASNNKDKSTIFAYEVTNPQKYGVIEFNERNQPISIEEKPQNPKSNYAIPGIYFYKNDVIEIAKTVKPSTRGELEITSIHEQYMKKNELQVEVLNRNMAWFDAGTYESLLEVSNFVHTVEKRQGLQVCCPEEIAYKNGWISKEQLQKNSERYQKNEYGEFLSKIDN